jgi:hypothetical protein
LDGAKADLLALLALDPTLKAAARELSLVKRQEAEAREAERKQFAGAFAKVRLTTALDLFFMCMSSSGVLISAPLPACLLSSFVCPS